MDPIAVVGFALKFPQEADSEQGFWDVLLRKQCTMTEWPKERLHIDAFHSLSRRESSSISGRGAHFLREDPAEFDAPFFSITATEAASLDPQQRGLLETTYRAVENAGVSMEALRGSSTGVYTGSMCDDYKLLLAQDHDAMPKYAATGSAVAMLANRISWFFDLTGPSVSLDSACSSSLNALHVACQGLHSGDTSMALVTGANLLLALDSSVAMSRMGFTSPDSRCYSFDDRANGYARGEGFAVVVLKRLQDAVRDNDTIRSVIRSTGSNQDGHTPGITQPSKEKQAQLIRHTYQKAGLDPAATRYFEAHGTGTAIGDPIEAAAIGSVFHTYRSTTDPIYVGAVKSNVGHLEGASGIAGLIKATLVLENGLIPPNTNFENVNPRIRADLLNLKFPVQSTPWPCEGLRRASVNSFGFGGSNAHVVLDDAYSFLQARGIEANHATNSSSQSALAVPHVNGTNRVNGLTNDPNNGHINGYANGYINGFTNGHTNGHSIVDSTRSQTRPKLLVWSAADENALLRIVNDYAHYHEEHCNQVSQDGRYLHHLAYTLSCRRTQFAWRTFAIAESFASLKSLPQLMSKPIRIAKEAGMIFTFTGQGAQYPSMGLQLMQYSVFRDTMTAFDNVLLQLGCEWSVFDESSGKSGNIDKPEYSQPLCTALQVSLIELLNSFNIVPSAVIGHSSGEIAAAYAVGAISLASAARISYHRGRVAGRLVHVKSTGSMLAVGLSESDVQPYLAPHSRLSVACVNSPLNITVAGDKDQIALLQTSLDTKKIFCRELKTGVAYHSSQMQQVAPEYAKSIQNLEQGTARSPSISMVSSVTGDTISAKSLRDPDYWVRNMVSPVRFSDALTRLASRPKTRLKLGQKSHLDFHDIVEIGPHSALQRPTEEVLKHAKRQLRYTTAVSRFQSATSQLMTLAGRLYCSGYKVFMDKVNNVDLTQPLQNRSLTNLPLYNFSRVSRNWDESELSKGLRLRSHFPRTLLGAPVRDWNPLEAKWRRYLSVKNMPWLLDHKIDGTVILPGTGMIALALEAAQQTAYPDQIIKGFFVKEARFSSPIIISTEDHNGAEVETYLRSTSNTSGIESAWSEARVCVRSGDRWNEACRAVLKVDYDSIRTEGNTANEELIRRQSFKERYHRIALQCSKLVDRDGLYRTYDKMGLQYGPSFKNLYKMSWDEKNAATADVRVLPRNKASSEMEADTFLIHPATLDAIAHLSFVPLTKGGTQTIQTSIPTKVRNAWISNVDTTLAESTFWRAAATASNKGLNKIESSMTVFDATGEVVMSIDEMESTSVAKRQDESEEVISNRLAFGLAVKPDVDMLELSKITQLKFHDYLEALAHKHPALKILELDAGTGALTKLIVQSLTGKPGQRTPLFTRYEVTDNSPEVLESARDKYLDLIEDGRMKFSLLDLSHDPVGQSMELGSYDLVVHTNRQHSPEREKQLENARRLLKADGKLLQIKSHTSENLEYTVWASESERPLTSDKLMIVFHPGNETQLRLAGLIQSNLSSKGRPQCELSPLNELLGRGDLFSYRFVFIAEVDQLFLSNINESEYADLKYLLSSGKGLLWVVQELQDSESWPETQMVHGLARVLRSENPGRPFVTLSLEDAQDLDATAEIICSISEKTGSANFTSESSELEYIFKDGIIQVRRVVESDSIDQYVRDHTTPQLKLQTVKDSGPLALTVGSPGVLDSIRFIRDRQYAQSLAPEEVEIEVRAVGLNFKDLLTALGRIDDYRFGVECAGVVSRVGTHANFQPGDRVFSHTNDCMRTYARCHADTVLKMPESLSFEEAAAFPTVGTTAYYSLIEMGRLQKGETILIHAGAGGTGQSCIQIAQSIGAEVYTTVSSQHKRDLLKSKYDLQDDHIFYSRNTSFAEAVKRATNGRGVDMLVNSLSGDGLVASWEVMAPFGRFIELGKADISANSRLPMTTFAKNVSFIAVNIDYIITHNTKLMKSLLAAVWGMVDKGSLTVPYPLTTYGFDRIEDAFRNMQGGKSTGKTVLTCQSTDVVRTYMVNESRWKFSPDATYLIAGGLGGLGRSAARWMAGKGAKNLVLLSRSGPTSGAAQSLVRELQGQGVHVEALRCDVTVQQSLAEVLNHCTSTMPPIRGCIQGTMVLRDALFENMSFAEWDVTIKSKKQASWNLHKLLPCRMDFFIMLSSLSGIAGTIGQANYAAGNAYQDALALFRNRQGENAASLDLGVMGGVGVIAEKDEYAGQRDGLGGMLRVVEEEDFHAILDYYCNTEEASAKSSLSAQALFGLPTAGTIRQKGGQAPTLFAQPMFRLLGQLDIDPEDAEHSSKSGDNGVNYGREFANAQTDGAAAAVVLDGIVTKLSRAISVPAHDIDTSKPLYQYGVDSLVAVELRNWLGQEFSSNVAVFSLMGAPSIQAVGTLVTESSASRKKG